MAMRLLICTCALAMALAASGKSSEAQADPRWETNYIPPGGSASDLISDRPFPELAALSAGRGAADSQSVAIDSSGVIRSALQTPLSEQAGVLNTDSRSSTPIVRRQAGHRAPSSTLEITPGGDTDAMEDLVGEDPGTASPVKLYAMSAGEDGSTQITSSFNRAGEALKSKAQGAAGMGSTSFAGETVGPFENSKGGRAIGTHSYLALLKDEPSLTPEAIFADKRIPPDVAGFLGHLAQRTRANIKEAHRATQTSGLAQSEGMQPTLPSGAADPDDSDDSDDIEDMKRAAARLPRATVLSRYFDKIDSKPLANSWRSSDCSSLAQNISDQYKKIAGRSRATWATVGPAGAAWRSEVHTGMFFEHWGIGPEAARKLRLAVLSFLGTQDAAKVRLHIWTDQEKHGNVLREVLGPIALHPELMDAITITVFDHKAEFAKVAPTLAREGLAELFKDGSASSNLRSDLYRSLVLYNYGGLWMDADTMLMQDVSPLLGEDWVYLGKGRDGLQGSLLSASKPQSHFTTAYLISLVMRHALGDASEKPLLVEVFDKDPSRTTLHALPPCFFDSDPQLASTDSAVLSSGTSIGSPFFGASIPAIYRAYFSMGIEDAAKDRSTGDASVLQDPSPHSESSDDDDDEEDDGSTKHAPVWAYHWRGNFAAAWARGSLADVAERTFMKRLKMTTHH